MEMSKMEFRAEYLRKKLDEGWVSQKFLGMDNDAPHYEVVFYHEADGLHYAMEYYCHESTGIDSFEGVRDDGKFECWVVEKKETVTVDWVKKDG